MHDRASRFLALIVGLIVFAGPFARGDEKPADPPKKILVELYTSQGCNSCPPASDLLGKLAGLGYGPDQIVPINFHVDYFNTPWADPFSDASYSRRQMAYNDVLKRSDLYFTPLMMVDGRYPLLGSDRPKALSSLQAAGKEAPGVGLELALEGTGLKKSLAVKLAARAAGVAGRELLVGVAVTEDRVTTKVPSGENAGRTLVEHHVVRRFQHKFTRLDRTDSRTLAFPVELATGGDPSQFHLTVFVQDRANGKVYQADAIPWNTAPAPTPKRVAARRKPRLQPLMSIPNFDFSTPVTDGDVGGTATTCAACGSVFIPPPSKPVMLHRGQVVIFPPVITC